MSSIKTIVTLALIATLSIVSIGCSDDVTSPVTVVDPPIVVVDTAPPAVPANFQMAYDGAVVTLTWDSNTTDADFDGYILSRVNSGEVTELVSTRGFFLSYTDTPALGLNSYQIYAVDLVGNSSAVASVQYFRTASKPQDDIAID